MRYVIIGNSTSAVSAIEAIREIDKKGQVTVISEEKYPNYSRPLISYFLGEKIDRTEMPFRSKEFYEKHRVNLLLNHKAEKLDVKAKTVRVKGKLIGFDCLLIATGGVPVKPAIDGAGLNGIFTFTCYDDAIAVKQYIKEKKIEKVVILGGGLIGLKACEAILLLKKKAVIIELADRLLSATFDKKASAIMENVLKKHGSEIITQQSIAKVTGRKGRLFEIILKDRRKIPARILIIAIGVRPNIELVKDTGIAVNKGILVNQYMQTSVPGIFAAGDVAEGKDFLFGSRQVTAIWTEAFRQGAIAGSNMAGLKKEYKGSLPMNSIELCGIPAISAGETNPLDEGAEILERGDAKNMIYKKIILRDNIITGFIFVNEIDRAGIYTGLIKERINVRDFKGRLLEEDFGVISLPREYRKHLVKGEEVLI